MGPGGLQRTNEAPFRWLRRSFPRKLATWMLLVAGLPLLTVMVWTSSLVAQTMTASLNTEVQALLTTSKMTARQYLDNYERSMRLFITAPLLQTQDPAVIKDFMDRLVNAHANLRWVGFVDPRGKLVIDSKGRSGQSFGKTEAFQAGRKDFHVSNVEPSQSNSYLPAIMYSAPVRAENGATLGVLMFELDLRPLIDSFRQGRIRLSGETYLVQGDGDFITPPRFSPWLSSNRVDSYGFRQAMAGHTGVAEYKDYRGVQVIGAFAPFNISEQPGSPRWAILSEVDAAEAFIPVHDVLWAIALVTLLMLGLVGVLAFVVSRQVSTPLLRLEAVAQRITQGDWSQRADERAPDEFGQLGQAFNRMAAKVEDVILALTTANQALDASERRFRLVVNNAPVILFAIRADGTLNFAEGRGLATLKQGSDHLVGLPVSQAIPDNPSFNESVRRALRGEIERDEVHLGDEVFQVWYSLIQPERGEGRSLVGVATNITAIKKLEAQLAQAQKIAHLGSWEWDLRTNQIQWSLEHFHLLGLAPQTTKPSVQAFRDRVHPGDRERIVEALRRTAQEGLPFEEDFRIVRPDGEVRGVHSVSEVVRDSDGRPVRAFGIAQDISERKLLELALRERNAQLQELDRLKSDFINSVSHDLRTPLTSILGYAEFLLDDLAGPLTAQQQEFVTQIERSTHRLAGMVNDLLDFARIEAGTFHLDREPVDLTRTMLETAESMRPQLDAANLKLELALPENAPPVEADSDRIQRVVANLLSNAIKFTPPGGTIRASAHLEGDTFVGEVTDTGPGIAKEDLPKLFMRFSQLEAGRRQKGGTGLGLSISKAIVTAHGGRMGVQSEPGKGSTFWFRLPLRSLKQDDPDLMAG